MSQSSNHAVSSGLAGIIITFSGEDAQCLVPPDERIRCLEVSS